MAPNDFPVVQAVFATGQYDLTTHDGVCAFTEAVVLALHAKDPKWGHLKKHPGQTQCSGHAEDAALYNDSTVPGTLQAVDFVAAAGATNARPAWQPDTPRYSTTDWYAPSGTPVPIPPPPPSEPVVPYHAYDGDDFWHHNVGDQLAADYARAHQALDARSCVWVARTMHDATMGEGPNIKPLSIQDSLKKHRAEWCAALGIPVT